MDQLEDTDNFHEEERLGREERRQSYKIICYVGNQLPTKIQGTVVEGRG